jgi:hypothetical protein
MKPSRCIGRGCELEVELYSSSVGGACIRGSLSLGNGGRRLDFEIWMKVDSAIPNYEDNENWRCNLHLFS